ncbi:MAG: RnfABCDGE type electron transport complex subunit A [Oscillospiraceae bacterium]|jgi:electron transport complex protein RnfA|nr:RnfABCDGE type electron transport complex subunit A [Oscillospiraceae bacterium]
MKEYIAILATAILTQNFVLAKFLGICPFLGVSKKVNTALGMSVAVIFVMLLSTVVTYPINQLLVAQDLAFLQTVVFILVIAALVQLVETTLKKFLPPLYESLGIYLPLITTNCAVLGVVLLNISEGYGFAASMINTLGAGIGFLVAMLLFAGVRQRMENSDIPKAFQGLPSTLIAAAITSLSFLGFSRLIEGMLG